MKLAIDCMECWMFNGQQRPTTYKVLEVRNDSLYEVVCERGHKNVTVLDAFKFEILFQMGLNALADGYHREAISSFAAALERFYELYIEVIMEKHELEPEVWERAWKLIAKQSERQLGAFIACYVLENKEPPTLLSNTLVEFRNNAIHSGYIPKYDEAVKYGDAVLTLVRGWLVELREACAESYEVVHERALRRGKEKASELGGSMQVQWRIPTAFFATAPADGGEYPAMAELIESAREELAVHRSLTKS